VVQSSEQCDDGANNSNNPNAHCRLDCTLPKCGDGVIDTLRGEQCDEGPNNSNASGAKCRMDCTVSRCGDSVVDPGEQCDDGARNGTPNDACSAQCTLLKAAAPALSTSSTSGTTAIPSPLPYEVALAAFGGLSVGAYVLRKRLHGIVSKMGGETLARSIDDIPLDEIEMPWHKW
jgi:cysteine-rich repeat protein